MPLPADHHASYTSSSEKIDLVCMRLATAAADVEKDSRAMENIIQDTDVRVIDTASATRRKIIPSMDLLHDCYSSDSSYNDPLSLSSTVTTSTDNGSATTSLKTPDSLAALDFFDDSVFDGELDWIDSQSSSAAGNSTTNDRRRRPLANDDDQRIDQWSTVIISDKEYRLDLKVIEPYKRVVSHGGYYGDGYNAIIVITACYLPDRGRRDYHYVMRNLFLYVISTLELLVMDDYMIIYFHGAAPRQRLPSFRWLRQCYEMTDRRYKKKLKKLLIVHPTFFLRTVMLMAKPFISSKFCSKLQYVRSLQELRHLVPMDHVFVCDEIKEYDALRPMENQNL